ASAQERVWCMLTDNGHTLAMARINCLVAADDDSTFHVLLSGGGVVENVRRATFGMDIPEQETQREGNPLAVQSLLQVTGISEDTPVEVYSADGRRVAQARAARVPVNHLPAGTYVVKVGGQSFKINKR
ncbi:MAG: T9SS type A sorting domain-containing protein, partial [Bacteroidaceae bacterium]|nr:T9SS type A sorting domain-containing protein [Bacteroidaceae bacterium]